MFACTAVDLHRDLRVRPLLVIVVLLYSTFSMARRSSPVRQRSRPPTAPRPAPAVMPFALTGDASSRPGRDPAGSHKQTADVALPRKASGPATSVSGGRLPG